MRIHGLSSPQLSGCQDLCTVRKTRSGCGIMIVKRPSAVVTPARPPGYKERAAILGIGLLSNSLIANGIDYVLYPWVIWTLGPLHGAAMMTVLSFLICWATLLFYDWAKKDWLGIETIKELKEYAGNSRFARVLRWAVAKGDAASSRCGPTPSSPWPICARAHTNTTA